MGIGYIDIGVNLLDKSFKKDLDDVIQFIPKFKGIVMILSK